jgi:hypothetical protein
MSVRCGEHVLAVREFRAHLDCKRARHDYGRLCAAADQRRYLNRNVTETS